MENHRSSIGSMFNIGSSYRTLAYPYDYRPFSMHDQRRMEELRAREAENQARVKRELAAINLEKAKQEQEHEEIFYLLT